MVLEGTRGSPFRRRGSSLRYGTDEEKMPFVDTVHLNLKKRREPKPRLMDDLVSFWSMPKERELVKTGLMRKKRKLQQANLRSPIDLNGRTE